MGDKQYSLSEAAKILGVTTKTLRNWDNQGKIHTTRTAGGHRRISEGVIQGFQLKQGGNMEKTPLQDQIVKATMTAHIKGQNQSAPLRPAVAKLADAKNQDEVIDFSREIVHEIEDILNARVTDEEYEIIEKTIFAIHARGLQRPAPEKVRPGYLGGIINPIDRRE
jgi:excisionase family DNA binding protein